MLKGYVDHIDEGPGQNHQVLMHPDELMNGHYKGPSKICVERVNECSVEIVCLALTWDPRVSLGMFQDTHKKGL